ncbi:MAG: rRNA maturation RNase YbeY [Chloroflexia bacterium]
MNSESQTGPQGGYEGFQDLGGAEVSNDTGSDYLITVQIDPQYEDRLDCGALHILAMEVLRAEGVPGPLELGVIVTTDGEVRSLNRDYLGHDYETDVISFAMSEEPGATGAPRFVTPEGRAPYLGDIAIAYDRAAEQAPDFSNTPEAEVATLLIHGLLHLLGYDDTEGHEHERMHARQQELLEAFYPGLSAED